MARLLNGAVHAGGLPMRRPPHQDPPRRCRRFDLVLTCLPITNAPFLQIMDRRREPAQFIREIGKE
jgi:hypothetical protein